MTGQLQVCERPEGRDSTYFLTNCLATFALLQVPYNIISIIFVFSKEMSLLHTDARCDVPLFLANTPHTVAQHIMFTLFTMFLGRERDGGLRFHHAPASKHTHYNIKANTTTTQRFYINVQWHRDTSDTTLQDSHVNSYKYGNHILNACCYHAVYQTRILSLPTTSTHNCTTQHTQDHRITHIVQVLPPRCQQLVC